MGKADAKRAILDGLYKKRVSPKRATLQEIISSYLLIDILQLRVVLSLEKRNLVYETL